MEAADGVRRGGRNDRRWSSWCVVVAAEGEQPLGMVSGKESLERNPCLDTPTLGSELGSAREKRLGDRALLEGFVCIRPVEVKLEDAVRGRHMEFVVGLLIRGPEENLESVALHEGWKVQGKDILHRVRIGQIRTDEEFVFREAERDLTRRKSGFDLRKPGLAEGPNEELGFYGVHF